MADGGRDADLECDGDVGRDVYYDLELHGEFDGAGEDVEGVVERGGEVGCDFYGCVWHCGDYVCGAAVDFVFVEGG